MSAIRQRAFTADGTIGALLEPIVIGETVRWTITCKNQDGTVYPVAEVGTAIQYAISRIDERKQPSYPPEVSHQCTVISAPAGTVAADLAVNDTIIDAVPISAGIYWLEVFTTDASGNRLALLGAGRLPLISAAVTPTTTVTPLPSQSPLGQAGVLNYAYAGALPAPSSLGIVAGQSVIAQLDDTRQLVHAKASDTVWHLTDGTEV